MQAILGFFDHVCNLWLLFGPNFLRGPVLRLQSKAFRRFPHYFPNLIQE